MALEEILDQIRTERVYQDGKWGTAFDDKNTLNDWSSYLTRYTGNATFADDLAHQRQQFVKVAALAVAALEASYRNNGFPLRHYDPVPLAVPTVDGSGQDGPVGSNGPDATLVSG